jgi:hypothetical protein
MRWMLSKLIGDRTGDDYKLAKHPSSHVFIDTALAMTKLPEFGSQGRTGMGAIGEKLGLMMPFKKTGWGNVARRVAKVRYGGCKSKPC